MRSSRNTITLLLALLLATAAAAGVYVFSNSGNDDDPETAQVAPTQAPTATLVPTTPVLFALQDIAPNTAVTADMVEVRQIPPADMNPRALTTPEEAIGMVTIVSLTQGEQVLTSRLAAEPAGDAAANTFAYEVPAGMRGFSLVFDEVIGVGALVQPGDHVDVIAYFEIGVKDPNFDQGNQSAPISEDSDEDSDDEENTSVGTADSEDTVDYTQYVTSYIVQDVEVLAVAQALTPEEAGVSVLGAAPAPPPTPTPTVTPEVDDDDEESDATVAPTAPVETEGDPVARPTAISVTLAVTPEQAQRLLLASETVYEEKEGSLRLALRSPGDTTTFDLPSAQLGEIPIGGLLGDVNQPMVPSEVVITDVEFTRRVLSAGELLEFTVTVKNISLDTTIEADTSVPDEFTYTQGTAYDSLGYYPDDGTYRLGLNVSGAYPTQYPYRWSLGRDLRPGESIEITGSIKMTEPTPATQYWFGVILEPDIVSHDGVGVAEITVLPAAAAVVSDRTADLLAEPSEDAGVIGELARDDYLTVLETRGDWFRVETADQTEGWVAVAAVEVVPPVPADAATPVSDVTGDATPASATPTST